MSSVWRNAVQRRNHKERAQPIERARYGILEKHKDYSLRARDFASKKSRLRALRQKAADRNPDEFSFAMISSRTDGRGVKIADRGNRPLSHEVVKLLKTQDAGYIRTMLQKTRKERERAEEEVQIMDRSANNGALQHSLRVLKNGEDHVSGRHIVFVDSKEEQIDLSPKASQGTREESPQGPDSWTGGAKGYTNMHDASGRQHDDAAVGERVDFDRKELRQIQRSQETRRRRLEGLREREQDLLAAEQELDLQRAKMNNAFTSGINKAGVKFKIRERKR
ncbi:MAG: hypothetical protein M1821_001512 [Bathelium mastoideum]|nr:MAG: hypothetical protein M1821_001512 [Bathelium mastoideum]KAI9690042.1 MAG: hypothetical protein M1822_009924 [Bathelium mastoideum]